MQPADHIISPQKNEAPTLVNVMFWVLYIGVLLPMLAAGGLCLSYGSVSRPIRPGPVVELDLFIVGAALFSFAILRATNLVVQILECHRKQSRRGSSVS